MGGNSTVEYLGTTAFVQQWVVDHLVEYDGRYYPPPRSAAFRVRWQGYGAKDDTWERAGGLPDDLKLEFWRDLQKGIGTEPARRTQRIAGHAVLF